MEAGYRIGAVITKPDARRGRSINNTEPQVKTYAKKNNIDVWQPQKLTDIHTDIKQFDSPVGVLVSYGKIIPQTIIDLFHPGIINIHPSLLPKYRGPTPIESAIANGDSETGVSIMKLDKSMDSGAIYSQIKHRLSGNETKPELYDTLGELGARELLRVLPGILDGSIKPTTQDDSAATYCPLLSKKDTIVDPSEFTAKQIEQRIRAHLGYPKTRLPFYSNNLIITKAHPVSAASPTTVKCKRSTFLAIDELITPNGKRTSAQAYLNGQRATAQK